MVNLNTIVFTLLIFKHYILGTSFPVCSTYIVLCCLVHLFHPVSQPLLISLDLASLMLNTHSIIRLLDWHNMYCLVFYGCFGRVNSSQMCKLHIQCYVYRKTKQGGELSVYTRHQTFECKRAA
jgi:hypothetical protein